MDYSKFPDGTKLVLRNGMVFIKGCHPRMYELCITQKPNEIIGYELDDQGNWHTWQNWDFNGHADGIQDGYWSIVNAIAPDVPQEKYATNDLVPYKSTRSTIIDAVRNPIKKTAVVKPAILGLTVMADRTHKFGGWGA